MRAPITLVPLSILLATVTHASDTRVAPGKRVSFAPPRVVPQVEVGAAARRPVSLTAADLDGDRLADLVVGFADRSGGTLSVYRTRRDSLWPSGPRARGGSRDIAPFHAEEREIRVGDRPDWLAAGDFDNDGHADVVFAESGARHVWLVTGVGDGSFAAPVRHDFAARVTAIAAGEVGRADGLADLAVAVEDAEGARLLVFEHPQGALRGAPEAHALPGPGTRIALADLDGDLDRDAIVLAGSEIVVVNGRDRKLTWPEERRAGVRPALVERHAVGSAPRGLAVGRVVDPVRNGIAWIDDRGGGILARGRTPARAEARSVGSGAGFVLTAGLSGNEVQDVVLVDSDARRLRVRRPDGVEESIALPGRPIAAVAMRLNADAVDDLVVLQEPPAAPVVALLSAPETVFLVTNADASGPGSLTQAILDANASAGIDAIHFDIPGTGPFLIPCDLSARVVTDTVTIDATTQPGYTEDPVVVLWRSDIICDTGLRISASNSAVHGLAIRDFPFFANLELGGSTNSVQGCWLGTDGGSCVQTGIGVQAIGVGFHEIGGVEPNVISCNIGAVVTTPETLTTASSDVPVSIPNNATVVSTLDVASERVLSDVNVQLTIEHGATGQLTLTLIHPDGTRVVLAQNRGGSGDDFLSTTFDDSAGTPISAATAPFPGSFRPEEPLAALNGKSALGAWRLEVTDDSNPSPGTLDAWSVRIGLRSTGTRIVGNRVGTNADGTAILGNEAGIGLTGEDEEVSGNLLSGHAGGVLAVSVRSRVRGNFFGTNATGDARLTNLGGIDVPATATDVLLGGTAIDASNLVSGSINVPSLSVQGAQGLVVQANRFGTDVTGTVSLGGFGAQEGIELIGDTDVLIGGTVPEARNLISGHDAGPGLSYRSTTPTANAPTILGNLIGTTANGLDPLPNGTHGISLRDNATGVTIGRNRIAFNAGAGVAVEGGSGHTIQENQILSNGGLGIEILGAAGPDANDPLDADTGPNGIQNHPVLTEVTPDLGSSQVDGTLHSTADTTFRIDFYGSAEADPSGFGEGATWHGLAVVATDATGNVAFSFPVSGTAAYWSATATAPDGSTSEFSATVASTGAAPAEASADGAMTADRVDGSVAVFYAPACDAIDHAVVWGTSPIAGQLSWTGAACGFGTFPPLQLALPDPPAGEFVYFVVVGQAATVEGSYGQDDAGAERPEAAGVAACDLPQSLASTCD